MIAGWPGMGLVALRSARYLATKLEAEPFAKLVTQGVYAPTGVAIRDSVIELPAPPDNDFHFWQRPRGAFGSKAHDLVFFVGEMQPDALHGVEIVRRVLDVAKELGVQRIYTAAAAVTNSVSHKDTPSVLGAATRSALLKPFESLGVVPVGDSQISGLNGLLLAYARRKGIDGVCLLAEVPQYVMHIENPKSSLAVLRVLTQYLGVNVDLSELEEAAEQFEAEIDRLIQMPQMAQTPISDEELDQIGSQLDDSGSIPDVVKVKIEGLFVEVMKDRSRANELADELRRWDLYEEYEDRFLELFKKPKGQDG